VLQVSFFIKSRDIKTQKNEAELKAEITDTEMKALRAQMNPHFIFNCLNSIDNLIQIDEKEKATLYLSKFAKLIRSILENSAHNEVPCWKDIETLNLYLQLEELRCDKKFSYQLVIADEILNGDYRVPPLVIQPFVENAIHHGLLNKIDGDKKLIIQVSVAGNHIQALVNGGQAFPAMLAAIEEATLSVSLATYIFDNDRSGNQFAEALGRHVAFSLDTPYEKLEPNQQRAILFGTRFARFSDGPWELSEWQVDDRNVSRDRNHRCPPCRDSGWSSPC